MNEVRFTRDYRGKLTKEVFYLCGDVVSFESDIAAQIVAEHAAEYVKTEESPAEETPRPKRKRRTRSADVEE